MAPNSIKRRPPSNHFLSLSIPEEDLGFQIYTYISGQKKYIVECLDVFFSGPVNTHSAAAAAAEHIWHLYRYPSFLRWIP